jgi:hypothetical protein
MKQQWLMVILLISVSYFFFSQSNPRNIGATVKGKNWNDSEPPRVCRSTFYLSPAPKARPLYLVVRPFKSEMQEAT